MFSIHRLLFVASKKVRTSKLLFLRFSSSGKNILPSSVDYFLAQSQGNSLSFRWKRTATLYWNLSSEHLLNNTLLTNTMLNNTLRTTHCSVLIFFSMQHIGKPRVNLNDLVVKVLDSQSRSPIFKTIGWIQGRLLVDKMSIKNFWELSVIK